MAAIVFFAGYLLEQKFMYPSLKPQPPVYWPVLCANREMQK